MLRSDDFGRAAVVNLRNLDERYLEEIGKIVDIEETMRSLEKQ